MPHQKPDECLQRVKSLDLTFIFSWRCCPFVDHTEVSTQYTQTDHFSFLAKAYLLIVKDRSNAALSALTAAGAWPGPPGFVWPRVGPSAGGWVA